MVVREAVQRYNGGNAFVARGRREVLENGTTEIVITWERTANTYHETILGHCDVKLMILGR